MWIRKIIIYNSRINIYTGDLANRKVNSIPLADTIEVIKEDNYWFKTNEKTDSILKALKDTPTKVLKSLENGVEITKMLKALKYLGTYAFCQLPDKPHEQNMMIKLDADSTMNYGKRAFGNIMIEKYADLVNELEELKEEEKTKPKKQYKRFFNPNLYLQNDNYFIKIPAWGILLTFLSFIAIKMNNYFELGFTNQVVVTFTLALTALVVKVPNNHKNDNQ